MDHDRTYIISRTLIGATIYYVARNKGGNIFARELTLEKLQGAIKAYKEQPIPKLEVPVESATTESDSATDEPKKKFLTNKLSDKIQQAKEKQDEAPGEIAPKEEPVPAGPKQIKNELQAQVTQKIGQSKKASFWDKLK